MSIPSNLKVGELVPIYMPAHRWLLLFGYLDAITDEECRSYVSDFLNEILRAVLEADRAAKTISFPRPRQSEESSTYQSTGPEAS